MLADLAVEYQGFPILSLIVMAPMLGALFILFVPEERVGVIRRIATVAATI